MDVDAYVQACAPDWDRLATLLRVRRLDGEAADELVELYQRVATQLSVIRSQSPDPSLVAHLSLLLARARTRAVGTRTSTWRGVLHFFTDRFPAALFRLRRWWLGMLLGNLAVTGVMMAWLLSHPAAEQTMMSPSEIDQLVNHEFRHYYSTDAASHFALHVWTNNVWVSAVCLALGILGIPVLLAMFQNVANLSLVGSVMIRHGHAAEFWGLILPHGMLELTAVFVAGGVGARLFWSWVEPGELTRSQSVAREGRTAATVALGLVVVLGVSGLIEAFVTPSPLPTWARIGIGAVAWTTFMLYVFVVGRAAVQRGETGDVGTRLLEDRVATQA